MHLEGSKKLVQEQCDFLGQKTHSGDFDFPPLKNFNGNQGLVRCFFPPEIGGRKSHNLEVLMAARVFLMGR